jgi:AraC-like DNA-binding protein
LRDFGLDPAAVFAEVGLSLELFWNRDNLIANVDACRLLRVCADLTRCDHFGLLVGNKSSLPSLGFVGSLASHSPDVGTALRSINRYLTLNNGAAIATLSEHGAHAIWGYAIYQRGLVDLRHLCQVASAVACNVLRALCGPHWMPDEVLLPFRRPRDTRAFRDVYRSPVRFDADHVNVVFGRSWLSRAIGGGDANVYAMLTRQAVRLDAQAVRTLPDVVRQVTRRLLLAGDVSIDHVALTLSVHRRTLHRKLCAHGMEFRRLADEVRFEVAQELLRDTAMSVSDVATALRYSSASALLPRSVDGLPTHVKLARFEQLTVSSFSSPIAKLDRPIRVMSCR